jgi:hypothetical protein
LDGRFSDVTLRDSTVDGHRVLKEQSDGASEVGPVGRGVRLSLRPPSSALSVILDGGSTLLFGR